MNGIDDARHRRAVAFDRGNDIVQLVRGRIEAFERLAAVRPFGGGYRRDERSDRAIVDRDLVGEKRAIGVPVTGIESGDRKSVVLGRSVSGRFDSAGVRIIKNKKTYQIE